MKALVAAIALSAAMSTSGAGNEWDEIQVMMWDQIDDEMAQMILGEPLKLKDGSYLFVNSDGTMRMVDSNGKPVSMKKGVVMELANGALLKMKDSKIQRHDHRDMKR